MSKIEEILKESEDFREESAKAINVILQKGKDLLKKGLNVIFEEYPNIDSISWNQYTPYFNDGDPCEFSVNTWDIKFESDTKVPTEIKSKVKKFIDNIGDDALECLGEGEIFVNRNGTITVEEYLHD